MAMLMNELYLAIIPMVHLGNQFGLTEQVMTLFPDKNFATFFSADEVDNFLQMFKKRAETYLKSGNVIGYEFQKIPTANGMFIVKVIQNVSR
jgi:hypothetical protein